MCGYPEELEFFVTCPTRNWSRLEAGPPWRQMFLPARPRDLRFLHRATPSDGIPYWDTGAPLLHKLGDYLERPRRAVQRI